MSPGTLDISGRRRFQEDPSRLLKIASWTAWVFQRLRSPFRRRLSAPWN